jgi:rhodanese-related sulfurtransferase
MHVQLRIIFLLVVPTSNWRQIVFGKLINEAQAKALSAKGAMVADLRDPVAIRDGSMPGTIPITLRQVSMFQSHPKDSNVVLIGAESDPSTVEAALRYIEGYGLTRVSVLIVPQGWKP